MLKEIGISRIDELFQDIPKQIRLNRTLKVGKGRIFSEIELEKGVQKILKNIENTQDYLSFLGGGIWPHHVPSIVKAIITRSEFYTSYTPYQPEISQGILQALFEYQSLMADLLEMDVVNVSMYDWSTALAEAILMASRITHKDEILLASNINPQHKYVAKTITEPKNIKIKEVRFDEEKGTLDIEDLKRKISNKTAAFYFQQPSYFGTIEDNLDAITEIVHDKESLLIVGVDPISLGILRPPGDYDADIVIGDAQPLGLGMNYGGPLLGIFATRYNYKFVRQMPGRLIGLTKDLYENKIGFMMILQTREQHIRREKATSNICTNEALCALASAVYLALLGPSGLKDLGEEIFKRSHYLSQRLSDIDGIISPYFKSEFFKEFTIKLTSKDLNTIQRELFNRKILFGIDLHKYFLQLENVALICVTEIHSHREIEILLDNLSEVI